MATGKQSVVIDSDEFAKGMTSSSNLTDGGFSPESDALNPIINPGVLYPPNGLTAQTNISVLALNGTTSSTATSLDGNPIASCYDTLGQSSSRIYDRWFITDNGGIYTIDVSNAVVYKIGATAASPTDMQVGACDMFVFGTNSSDPCICFTTLIGLERVRYHYADKSSAFIGTHIPGDWGGNNPHPMVIFNKLLFYADGNHLHSYDGASSFVDDVLTLQSDQVITSLEVDPYTGRMIIGISSRGYVGSAGDKTTAVNSPSFLGLYDGVNPTQLIRKVPVDGTITAIRNCGGVTYVAYGNRLGFWNGQGIQFLRNLNYNGNVGGVTTNVYKHKMTNVDNLLFFVANGSYPNTFLSNNSQLIVGYGEIIPGTRAFFNYLNQAGSNPIDFVSNVQNTGLLFSVNLKLYTVSLVNKASVASTGDTSPIFVSKRYALPRPSVINEVRVYFEDMVSAGAGTIGNVSLVTDSRSVGYNVDVTGATMVNTTRFDAFPQTNTTEFQVKYQWKETSTSHGVQKIMVFYTPYE